VRIDRCRSPYIQSEALNQLIQGMRVFAIGSPLGVVDSVSLGSYNKFEGIGFAIPVTKALQEFNKYFKTNL
jgi:S1-C subfamily serine protease